MDLRYSESDEKFRAELRAWLKEEVPAHGTPPPVTIPCYLIQYLVDSGADPVKGNENSPDGNEDSELYLANLQNAYVYFQHNVHDGFMRHDSYTSFGQKLHRMGIPHTDVFFLRTGHGGGGGGGAGGRSTSVAGEIFQVFASELLLNPSFVPADFDPIDYGLNYRHGLMRLPFEGRWRKSGAE